MAKTIEISICCKHCNRWFPSPIFMSDSESFSATTLFENEMECTHCKKMTGCDEENFRARFEGGGFLGVKT